MIKRFRVFRDEGDTGGDTNPNGEVIETKETNVVEKTGWLAGVKDDIFNAHKEELGKHTNVNTVLEDYFTLKGNVPDVPEEATGYELEAVEGTTENKDFDSAFKDFVLDKKLTKEQANGLYKDLRTLEAKGAKAKADALENAKEETTKAMKTEYGSEYDATMAHVVKVLELGGFELKDGIEKSDFGNSPKLIKALAKIGSAISEDSLSRIKSGQQVVEQTLANRLYPNQGKK